MQSPNLSQLRVNDPQVGADKSGFILFSNCFVCCSKCMVAPRYSQHESSWTPSVHHNPPWLFPPPCPHRVGPALSLIVAPCDRHQVTTLHPDRSLTTDKRSNKIGRSPYIIQTTSLIKQPHRRVNNTVYEQGAEITKADHCGKYQSVIIQMSDMCKNHQV